MKETKLNFATGFQCSIILPFSIFYCYVVINGGDVERKILDIILFLLGIMLCTIIIKLYIKSKREYKEAITVVVFLYLEYWLRMQTFDYWPMPADIKLISPWLSICSSEISRIILYTAFILYINKKIKIELLLSIFLIKGFFATTCNYFEWENKGGFGIYYLSLITTPYSIFYLCQLMSISAIAFSRKN